MCCYLMVIVVSCCPGKTGYKFLNWLEKGGSWQKKGGACHLLPLLRSPLTLVPVLPGQEMLPF